MPHTDCPGTSRCGGQDHFYLEGQVSLAVPREDGGMLVHCSTQHPGEVQLQVAHALAVDAHDVTVECRRMGGAFGGKESQAALFACVAAIIARQTGRAVKMRVDRDDDMMMTGKRHAFQYDYDVGFDATGRIRGIELSLASRCGFSADLSGPVNDRAMFHVDNAYFLENVAITSYRCKTNTVSETAFRGFGGPQGMFAIEYVLEEIAQYLGKDPLDVRGANFYGAAPRNVTHYTMPVDDNVSPELVARLAESSRYRERRAEIAAWNRSSPVLKRGIALTPVKFGISFTATHYNQAGALVNLYADGTVLLNHGGTEMGQGLYTKVAQVVAHELGVTLDRVRVTAADTSKVPNASATAASSGSDLNGMAAQAAARTIRERLVGIRKQALRCRRNRSFDRRQRRARCKARAAPRAVPAVCLSRPRFALRRRFLCDAEDSLRPQDVLGSAILLFRVRRRRFRSRHRHADGRKPPARGRHPPRRRVLP